MRNAERWFIYTALAAAFAIGLGWRGLEVPAMAQAGATAPKDAAAEPVRLASVDALGIIERLITSEQYRTAREANTREQDKKLSDARDPLIAELREIQGRAQALDPASPEIAPLQQSFGEKQSRLQELERSAVEQVERFNTEQVAEAYRITVAISQDIAQKLGYTHVLATRSGDPKIHSNNVAGAVQEVLARPLVKGNPADDITARVTEELHLPPKTSGEVPPPVATPVPAPAPVKPAPATPDK